MQASPSLGNCGRYFVRLHQSNGVINNSEFVPNAGCSGYYHCISDFYRNLSVLNTELRNNNIHSSSMLGCTSSFLHVQNVMLLANSDGAFYFQNCRRVHMDSSFVVNGTSAGQRAMLTADQTPVIISSSMFSYNTQYINANMWLIDSTLNINRCSFSYNSAERFGAVLFLDQRTSFGSSTVYVSSSRFEQNSASDQVGVIYSGPRQEVTFTNC